MSGTHIFHGHLGRNTNGRPLGVAKSVRVKQNIMAEHKRATTQGRPYGVGTSCAPFRFFCLHAVLFVGTIHELSVWCCGKKRAIRESPLRRQDKLRSVPIFEMKISHMLRCPSFSAKSHVCECLVFINAHIYAFAALPTFHGIYGKRLKS